MLVYLVALNIWYITSIGNNDISILWVLKHVPGFLKPLSCRMLVFVCVCACVRVGVSV